MFNDKGLTTTWIESFALKGKSEDKFSFLTSAFTVVICSILLILSAKIKVDLYPVPMTLQPLAILMIAMLCGRNIAVSAISLYLFQGIIGFPVFAYGGGFAYLMGPTGGFLLGFLIAGIAIGELADRGWGKNIFKSAVAMLIGLFIIYFFGIMQLSLIKGFDYAILKGMQPFIIGDLYKLLLASLLLPQIWKMIKKEDTTSKQKKTSSNNLYLKPNNEDDLSFFGLNQNYTFDELKTARIKKIKENHPDKVYGMSDEIKSIAKIQTQRINDVFIKLQKNIIK